MGLRRVHIFPILLLWTTYGTLGNPAADNRPDGLEESQYWRVTQGPWLQEFEYIAKDANPELDYIQGDDPVNDLQLRPEEGAPPMKCPDPPQEKDLVACTQPTCHQDSDCPISQEKCCDNGCVMSCVRSVRDSVVLDWEQQPLPQPDQETSWLIPEPYDEDETQGACLFENRLIPPRVPFQYENHPCVCDNGEVDCDMFPQRLPEI